MPDRIIPNTAGLQPDAPKTWPRRRTFGELSRVALRSWELIPTGDFSDLIPHRQRELKDSSSRLIRFRP